MLATLAAPCLIAGGVLLSECAFFMTREKQFLLVLGLVACTPQWIVLLSLYVVGS